jgi:hypothetical protein
MAQIDTELRMFLAVIKIALKDVYLVFFDFCQL